MAKYKVTMICREIWRADTIVDIGEGDANLEEVKDLAWLKFDAAKSKNLEQENYTKVEKVENPNAN